MAFSVPSAAARDVPTRPWDNDLHPDPRGLAARIARIERHLGLWKKILADIDPPPAP
jgi:hypothetical protein